MDLQGLCSAERAPSLAELLGVLKEQGYAVALEGGRPRLKAPKGDAFALALAGLLGREPYRSQLLASLGARRRREWLFAGGVVIAEPDSSPGTGHPSRATRWRYEGEADWKAIPDSEREYL